MYEKNLKFILSDHLILWKLDLGPERSTTILLQLTVNTNNLLEIKEQYSLALLVSFNRKILKNYTNIYKSHIQSSVFTQLVKGKGTKLKFSQIYLV